MRGLFTPDWIILPYLVWCSNSSYYTFYFQITVGVFSPDGDLADTLESKSDSRWGPEVGYRSTQHTLAASGGKGKRCHGSPVMPSFQSPNFLSLPQFFPCQNPTGNQLTLGMQNTPAHRDSGSPALEITDPRLSEITDSPVLRDNRSRVLGDGRSAAFSDGRAGELKTALRAVSTDSSFQ